MKIVVQDSPASEPTVTLKLVREEFSVHIQASNSTGSENWTIGAFTEHEGKLILELFPGIDDPLIDTDDEGVIKNIIA